MKNLKRFKLIGVSVALAIGLSACEKPGPAETAGKKIDHAASTPGEKISGAVDTASVAIEDTEITTKVKAAILAEPDLKTLQISVDTVKGVVTLEGSVNTASSVDRAKELASAVAGVIKVDNRLVLAPVGRK